MSRYFGWHFDVLIKLEAEAHSIIILNMAERKFRVNAAQFTGVTNSIVLKKRRVRFQEEPSQVVVQEERR